MIWCNDVARYIYHASYRWRNILQYIHSLSISHSKIVSAWWTLMCVHCIKKVFTEFSIHASVTIAVPSNIKYSQFGWKYCRYYTLHLHSSHFEKALAFKSLSSNFSTIKYEHGSILVSTKYYTKCIIVITFYILHQQPHPPHIISNYYYYILRSVRNSAIVWVNIIINNVSFITRCRVSYPQDAQ